MVDDIKRKPTVFVSHSGDDRFLDELRKSLPSYDIVVSDCRDESGTNVADKVQNDIHRADLVAVLLTVEARKSGWFNQEIGFARGKGKKILPIVEGEPTNLAMLTGLECEAYNPQDIKSSALRVALRIGEWLKKENVQVFKNCHDYREWWLSVDENDFTTEKCYWATPHDTWGWLMAHEDEVAPPYRTLIRGDYEFDRLTAKLYEEVQEVVVGVNELSQYHDIAVFGSLSVETSWESRFSDKMEDFLRGITGLDIPVLSSWLSKISFEPTEIEVRMYMDDGRANRHRRQFDFLYDKHKKD